MKKGLKEKYLIKKVIIFFIMLSIVLLNMNKIVYADTGIVPGKRWYMQANFQYYIYDGTGSVPTLKYASSVNDESNGGVVTYTYHGETAGEEYFERNENPLNYAGRDTVQMSEIWNWNEGTPNAYYNTGDEKLRDKYTDVDLDETMDSADTFLGMGKDSQEIPETNVKSLSKTIYNTLFAIGIIIAFVVGGILAIKFITGSVEGRVEVKQMLLPYVIGLVVLFGSFTIWEVVINLQKDILPDKNVSVEERNYTSTQTTFGPSSHSSSHSTGEDDETSLDSSTQTTTMVQLPGLDNMTYKYNVIVRNGLADYGEIKSYALVKPEDTDMYNGMPMIVFLHGISEDGKINEVVNFSITKYVATGKAYESGQFVYLAPCSNKPYSNYNNQDIDNLINLINKVADTYKVNKNKISITGFSSGSSGMFKVLNNKPDFFYSAVGISGQAYNEIYDLNNIKNIAVLGFVGTSETETTKDGMDKTFKIMQDNGGNAKLFKITGATHQTVHGMVYTDERNQVWDFLLYRKSPDSDEN